MERIWHDLQTVRHHACGPDGTLKLHVLFDYLQDAAAQHADHLGVGIRFLAEHRMLWVLSRIRLRILRLPAIGETVDERIPIFRSLAADHAMALRCEESRTLR